MQEETTEEKTSKVVNTIFRSIVKFFIWCVIIFSVLFFIAVS